MDELAVDINQSELHDIDIETDRFETAEPFRIRIHNHGEPSHVHLSFHGDLANAISIPEPNHFVKPDEETVVPVQLIPARLPATGNLEVSLAYGSQSKHTTVELADRSVPDRTVSQSSVTNNPHTSGSSPRQTDAGGLNRRFVSVVVVALLAVAAVVLALIQTNFNPIVFAGAAIVLGTIGGGFVYILRQ